MIKQIKFSTKNAFSFTGEQSFKFGRGGGGLWEGRVTVILFVNSFSPIGVLAVCVFGIGTIWGPYVRSEIA